MMYNSEHSGNNNNTQHVGELELILSVLCDIDFVLIYFILVILIEFIYLCCFVVSRI